MKAGKRQDRTGQPTLNPQPKKPNVSTQKKRASKKQRTNAGIIIISSLLALVVITLVVVISVSSGSSKSETKPNNASFSKEAMDFALKDTQGKLHKLSDYAGKLVLLDFSASWCQPCKNQMPAIKKLYEEFKDKVEFFTITGEAEQQAINFKENEGIPWPVLVDTNSNTHRTYKANSIPKIILLDANGKQYIEQSGNKGDMMYIDFKAAINQLFSGDK